MTWPAAYGVRLAFEALAWGTSSTTTAAPGGSWSGPTTPGRGVPGQLPHPVPRPRPRPPSPTSRPRRSSSCSSRTRPPCRWTCCPGAVTTGCSPGEGAWDLGDFVGRVAATGYAGPYSLEVFNDTFRQTDTRRTAAHAHRSLVWVADQAARWAEGGGSASPIELPRRHRGRAPTGIDFVEIKAGGHQRVRAAVRSAGVRLPRPPPHQAGDPVDRGRSQGDLERATGPGPDAAPGRGGLHGAGRSGLAAPGVRLGARSVYRRTHATEVELPAVAAPDGTHIFLSAAHAEDGGWVAEFEHGEAATESW